MIPFGAAPGGRHQIVSRPLDDRPKDVLYGRRQGRRLRSTQRRRFENDLPALEIGLPPGLDEIDPRDLFDVTPTQVWLEVGFGAGEHLLAQAQAYPEIGFIGCEPYLNGVVKLIRGIREHELRNIRVLRDDARILLRRLPDRSLDRVFVLFPDPWPKTRHHKRRFISEPVLAELGRVLDAGAELRVASDDRGYVAWSLRHILRHGGFVWTARRPLDWRMRPVDWPATRYEAKAIGAGRRCAFLRFVRVASVVRIQI